MPQWLIYVLVAALALVVVLVGLGWLAWATCRWLDRRRDRQCQAARAKVLARIAAGHVNEPFGGEAATPGSGLPAEVPQRERSLWRSPSPVRRPPSGLPTGRHARTSHAGNGGAPVRSRRTASVSRGS